MSRGPSRCPIALARPPSTALVPRLPVMPPVSLRLLAATVLLALPLRAQAELCVSLASRTSPARAGETLSYALEATLERGDVTLLAVDLAFDGGPLTPCVVTNDDALALTNPQGPGGVSMSDGRLVQVGAALDVLTVTGAGDPSELRGWGASLATGYRGELLVPQLPGRYTLRVEAVVATCAREGPDAAVTSVAGWEADALHLEVSADGAVSVTRVPAATSGGPAVPPLQPLAGEPLPDLDADRLARFVRGRDAFFREFTAAEGLGPIFNDHSCFNCHREPAIGGFHHRTVTRFGRRGPPFDSQVASGGPVLQLQSTHPRAIEYLPVDSDVQALRLTQPLFGVGLVERIPDEVLRARAMDAPVSVRGRAHIVPVLDGGPERLGRFGWKAQLATLVDFTADALSEEMGITNRLLPHENQPNGDPSRLVGVDPLADPEDQPDASGADLLDRMVDFQRWLAPAPQTPRSGMEGEAVFAQVGCADCHVPGFVTPPTSASDPLGGRAFRPYSDFLLHDMGALGDGLAQSGAGPREMRTPPLWGLSLRDAFLHDGRSAQRGFEVDVDEAIRLHAGQGEASRGAYLALPAARRTQLLAFLRSLGRAEHDGDGDHDVDGDDWDLLRDRLTGPGSVFSPDDPRAVGDVDGDGDLDLIDVAAFQVAATAPRSTK